MALFTSQSARAYLGTLGSRRGKIVVGDPRLARRIAESIGAGARDRGLRQATPGEIYALDRIESALHRLVRSYVNARDPVLFTRVVAVDDGEGRRLLDLFGSDFSLAGDREVTLGELVVWMVIDENPAARHASDFFLAGPFRSDERLGRLLAALEVAVSPAGQSTGEGLMEMLRAPARAEPDSLAGQLRFILNRWGERLELDRASFLRGLDLLAEEAKEAVFGKGGGPIEAPSFAGLEGEGANYSPDRTWMPGVVLLAKTVPVWLYQLSVELDRKIERLDQLPDEILDEMADQGFSALWLIGVWERSEASRRLKQLHGNPEAAASAYSIRAYRVAAELGGEEALDQLSRRCAARGIRLAADMVPNHTGIDSDWLLDSPDRFLSTPRPPFPGYTFTGPDLSPRPEIGIIVEDHYYDHSDAAVVFKRVDRRSGDERFIYHGNDGTSMPWNDTAQLDFFNPDTREAVIQTLFRVARRFPVIRLDAAMTLARRHYQRLWFPAPGTGGAIPSRTEHGLSHERFNELMPVEFWREVVDRFAIEAPDTLLLAEAFWLMEGYFVRTLGMHRVYNSAFMHMVRDRDNANYRKLIKDTLAFDPQILGRYVNFLTNPDERTAVDQFGRGDRYFGACVLLATLPGLPMFGHGQIHGYAEKYGMEYSRSYHQEPADVEFLERHRREIFPLLRRREKFAGIEEFDLYDFVDERGEVNEDVYAYSNGLGAERALVVFNNSPNRARGRIRDSAPRAARAGRSLVEALALEGRTQAFWILEDQVTGRSFVRAAAESARSGLELDLPEFGYHVFHRLRTETEDAQGRLGRLHERLAGGGVADLGRALADLELEGAADELQAVLDSAAFRSLAGPDASFDEAESACGVLAAADDRVADLLPEWAREATTPDRWLDDRLSSVLALCIAPPKALSSWYETTPAARPGLVAITLIATVGERGAAKVDLPDRLRAADSMSRALRALGLDERTVRDASAVATIAWRESWTAESEPPTRAQMLAAFRSWIENDRARALLGWHRQEAREWVRQEGLEALTGWRLALALVAALRRGGGPGERRRAMAEWVTAIGELRRQVGDAGLQGYRVLRRAGLRRRRDKETVRDLGT